VNATACVDFYSFSGPCFPHLQATTRTIAIWLFCVLLAALVVTVSPSGASHLRQVDLVLVLNHTGIEGRGTRLFISAIPR
jgi:hypothetical protein